MTEFEYKQTDILRYCPNIDLNMNFLWWILIWFPIMTRNKSYIVDLDLSIGQRKEFSF